MKFNLIVIAFFWFLSINCFSQMAQDTTLVFPVGIIDEADSLRIKIDISDVSRPLYIPDSVYVKRLSVLPFDFSMTYNPVVRRYIEVYTIKIKDKLQIIMGLSDFYFPIFDQVLKEYQLPNELKYIPIIESALNPRAVSRANAVGLWQFIKSTGKENGLTINNYVDERKALTESTRAAARHLKNLYRTYKDWQLVLAAYNCGPGNVNKAIRRAGGKRTFWEIYKYLPRETRGYVPEFIAAAYAFNYSKEHNINHISASLPTQLDTVVISQNLHLKQVSDVLRVNMDTLRLLNPQYFKDIIPASDKKTYVLTIPCDQKLRFAEQRDSIYSFQKQLYADEFKSQSSPMYTLHPVDLKRAMHRVQPGDSLWQIAKQYNITVNDIKRWNNIQGNLIRQGQKLIIHRPAKA